MAKSRRRLSQQTKKKISESLRKYYSFGGKRGAKGVEKRTKRKARTEKSIRKTTLYQQSLTLKQRILRLTKQLTGIKSTSPKAKNIRDQIRTLRAYRKNLALRVRSIT